MTVYNRKMFRKKGGATGIMASGPELMRRANGGGINVPDFRIPGVGTRSTAMGLQNLASLTSANPVTQIPTNFFGQSNLRNIPQGIAAMEASGLGVKGTGKIPEALQFVTLPNGQRVRVLSEDGSTPRDVLLGGLKNPSIARLYREQKEKFLSSPDIQKFQDIDPSATGEPTTPEFTQKKIAAEDKAYDEKIQSEDDPSKATKEKTQAEQDYEDRLEEAGTTLAEQINLRNFKALDPKKTKEFGDDIKTPEKTIESGVVGKSEPILLEEKSFEDLFKNKKDKKITQGQVIKPGKIGNASNAPNSDEAKKVIDKIQDKDLKQDAAASTKLVEEIRNDASKGELKDPEYYRNLALEFKGVDKGDASFDDQRRQSLFLRMMEGGLRAFAGEKEYASAMADAISGFGKDLGQIRQTESEKEDSVTNLAINLMNSDKQADQFKKTMDAKFKLQQKQLDASLKNIELQIGSREKIAEQQNKINEKKLDLSKKELFINYMIANKKIDLGEKELKLKEKINNFDQDIKISEFGLKKERIKEELRLKDLQIRKDSAFVEKYKALGYWDKDLNNGEGGLNEKGQAAFLAMNIAKKNPLEIEKKGTASMGTTVYGYKIESLADGMNFHSIIMPQLKELQKSDIYKESGAEQKNKLINQIFEESGILKKVEPTFVDGQIYVDGSGNQAKYENGKFIPINPQQ